MLFIRSIFFTLLFIFSSALFAQNHAPTDVRITNDIFYFNGEQLVGILRAVDEDISDTHTYFLDSNGSKRFEIRGDQLWIKDFTQTSCIPCEIGVVIHVSDGSDWETYGFEKVIYIQLENHPEYEKLILGREVTNYRIISVPALSIKVDGVLSAWRPRLKTSNYGIVSAVYEYQSLTGYQLLRESSSIIGGKGYWVIINAKYGSIGGPGNAFPVLINERGEFEMNLDQGWNLVGNPFREALDWDEELAYNISEGHISDGQVSRAVTYDGAYNITGSLDVLDGAFVYATTATTFYLRKKRYFDNAPSSQRVSRAQSNSNIDWELEIVMSSKNQRTNLGGVGMSEFASFGIDKKDYRIPPSLSNEYSFHMEDKFGLSRNIVSPSEQYIWDYSIKANGYLKLEWDNGQIESLNKEIWMELLPQGKFVNLNDSKEVSFQSKHNQSVRIYYGILPEMYQVEVFPNPTKSEVSIMLNSSFEGLASILVKDIEGKQVMLDSRRIVAGQNHWKWDLRDESGLILAPGLYFYSVSFKGKEDKVLKVIVK